MQLAFIFTERSLHPFIGHCLPQRPAIETDQANVLRFIYTGYNDFGRIERFGHLDLPIAFPAIKD